MDENTRTAELRRKLEKDPASRLFAQLAEELRKDGRHDEAIAVARGGLEKNPNYPSARLTLARALLDSGRPAEARPELETVVRASPDNILAGRLLAETLAELGEIAPAIKQFERTLVFSPGDKAITERIAELRSAQRSPPPPRGPVSPTAAAPSAAAPPAHPAVVESPSLFAEAAPLPAVDIGDGGSLPSLFADEPQTVPAFHAPPMPEAPGPSAPALDRDLASGTFSPGSLNVADLQKHFEAAAAAEQITSVPTGGNSSKDLEATIGTGDLPALAVMDDPYAVDETLNLRALPAMDDASVADETLSLGVMPTVAAGLPAIETADLPAVEESEDASDPGGATLPLTSMTLADLYLQQGLKQEASAVLSQVVRDEPDNAVAQSRLAQVSASVSAQASPVAPAEVPAVAPVAAAAPPVSPPPAVASILTKAQIRERTVLSLKAFQGAVEREALQQKASERTAY